MFDLIHGELTKTKAKNRLRIEEHKLKYCKMLVAKLLLTPNILRIRLLNVNCGKASVVACKNEILFMVSLSSLESSGKSSPLTMAFQQLATCLLINPLKYLTLIIV